MILRPRDFVAFIILLILLFSAGFLYLNAELFEIVIERDYAGNIYTSKPLISEKYPFVYLLIKWQNWLFIGLLAVSVLIVDWRKLHKLLKRKHHEV